MKSSYVLIAMAILFACKEEPLPCTDPTNPECPNFDPCIGVEPVIADFVMIDSITGFPCTDVQPLSYILKDMDYQVSKRVYLRALHDADSYDWYIQPHSIHTFGKIAYVDFPTVWDTTQLEITLVTKKILPPGCIYAEQDTLSQTLQIIPYNNFFYIDWSYIIGIFRGVDRDFPNDSFDITFTPDAFSYGVNNFPDGCVEQYHDVTTGRYVMQFKSNATAEPCYGFCGVGVIHDDLKTLEINYQIRVNGELQQKKWLGRKLN